MMIAFTGDLFLSGSAERIGGAGVGAFRDCELVVTNFESVIGTDAGVPRPDKVSILASTEEALQAYLAAAGSRVLFTLANNHIHDLGEPGISETLDVLRRNGCAAFGVGRLPEVREPKVVEVGGRAIAFFAVATDEPEVASKLATEDFPGVFDYGSQELLRAISEWKGRADLVVVLPHWGKEHVDYPSIPLRKKAWSWIDAGADLVVGTHPHVIQGKEQYRGKWIYYSLGNYLFPEFATVHGVWTTWSRKSSRSVALRVDLSGGLEIREVGFEFDTRAFVLRESREALEEFDAKSAPLDVARCSLLAYLRLWEKNYFSVLARQKRVLTRVRQDVFARHERYGVARFLLLRLARRAGLVARITTGHHPRST